MTQEWGECVGVGPTCGVCSITVLVVTAVCSHYS